MRDTFNRTIDYLRISVTDRCDLRCKYCMPEGGVTPLTHGAILSYEEMIRLAECFARLGIRRIKITGGEPMVRLHVMDFIEQLKQVRGIEQVTLTTNGTHLEEYISQLAKLQIDGINISLDTLNPVLYKEITGRDVFDKVFSGLKEALKYSNIKLKINCVPQGIPGQNIVKVAELAKNNPIHVRFIEMMPIGLGKNFTFTSENDVMRELEQAYGTLVPFNETLGNGPCHYYSVAGFQGKIGFISAMSHKFCSSCNRLRLTADGKLKTCLQYDVGMDLKEMLRTGKSDNELIAAILQVLESKPGEHHFAEEFVVGKEMKSMFQIGG
ncbi:cyclic pyranopterin phosphate synthase [Propionispira arboris]|uniref:GTP 3',8-cyclase n=1 Tax=Propionispira arboris TaxID=84035 RepID=A0A1H6XU74_9FIRM|nr:GTP 3',8-cyclase MoaA [Propionispira arboris]SEJ28430.1 cyclic pyranopterin phosphate synthase [Propionispira arboris]